MNKLKKIEIDDAFLAEVRARENEKHYKIFIPIEVVENNYCGNLYGYYIENTCTWNAIATENTLEKFPNLQCIGSIICKKEILVNELSQEKNETGNDLEGVFNAKTNELKFTYYGNPVKIETYSFISDIFSRTKGILESDKMLQKRAVIVGCGSGGSFIALELAKSGVGHFLLSDNDIFGYHNISRHQCGIYDVGKRKVDALKERILAINPYAEVLVYNERIQKIYEGELDAFIDKNTIILSCGDNRGSAHHCNYLSEKYNVPFIAAGAGHRASTGEIFYYIPNTDMPCYSCTFGDDLNLDYSNEAQRVWYSTEEELEKQDFEPGLSTDIDYISVIACKLAIDLLNRETGKIPKVLGFLPQYTSICNYMCDKQINPMIQIFQHPLQIKTRGLTTVKRDDCYLCARIAKLKKKVNKI